jgi:hypothetical protein
VPDECDIADATSPDCNSNAVPDECDLTAGTSEDCNTNVVPDECDLATGTSEDCNANDVPDECDIATGVSEDCNVNGVPDDCDLVSGASADCNGNDSPDECDIDAGTSEDCQPNGIPDECDVNPAMHSESPVYSPLAYGSNHTYVMAGPPAALGNVTLTFSATGDIDLANENVSVELNGLALGQIYTVEGMTTQCSGTPVADEIVVPLATWNAQVGGGNAEIAMIPGIKVNDICTTSYISVTVDYLGDAALDCNANGVPDECETDCNENGVPDDCDIAAGTSLDENENGIPDECEGGAVCHCGDLDGDGGAVDLGDFSYFSVCFGLRAPTAQCPAALFSCADLNQDEWVNLTDFSTFQVLFGTENTNSPPNCQ